MRFEGPFSFGADQGRIMMAVCGLCNGKKTCRSCDGTGKMQGGKCPSCNGTKKCSSCFGTGRD